MSARRHLAYCIALLAGIALLGISPQVRAGWNGQQVSFRTFGADLERVRITGDNQADRAVTWDSSRFGVICNASRCDEARTNNWWFKGKVTVEYQLRGDNSTHSCHFYVNERETGSWISLTTPDGDVPGRSRDNTGESEPKCLTSPAATARNTSGAIPHGLCDRAYQPGNNLVAAATADVIAVVRVAAIDGETATLQIEQVLKSSADAQSPASLKVPGIPEDSIQRVCRGNAATIGQRYIALLWRPILPESSYQLIGDDFDALLVWSPAEQQSIQKAVANPLPVSKWRAGPDGIQTQLTLAQTSPAEDAHELNLLMFFRNTGTKPVEFRYSSWPPAGQSRCAVTMIPASKRRISARDVPIARKDIKDYFQANKNGRKYDWTTDPGQTSGFVLQRVTTAAAGWGYKEELGFKYYPAPPGLYSVSAKCVNFLADGATLSTEPIEVQLQ